MNNTALKWTIGIVLFFVVLFLIDRLVKKGLDLKAKHDVLTDPNSYYKQDGKKLIPTGLFQQPIVSVGGKPKTKDKLIQSIKKKKRKFTSR